MTPKSRLLYIAFGVCAFWALPSLARDVMPNSLEPQYAEAILAIRGKQYKKALDVLSKGAAAEKAAEQKKKAPAEFKFLEGLANVQLGDFSNAEQIYGDLIENGDEYGLTPEERANAEFELGLVLSRQNKGEEAASRLKNSAKTVGSSPYYFLGVNEFQAGRIAKAEDAFREATTSDSPYVPEAYLYLARIAQEKNAPQSQVVYLAESRDSAKRALRSTTITKDVKDAHNEVLRTTEKGLSVFKKNSWLLDVRLLSGYDTNVLLSPDETATTAGSATLKQSLQFGVGYVTSALKDFQYITQYRFSGAYHVNRETRSGQFLIHDLSLAINHKPLNITSYGMRAQVNWSFRFGEESFGADEKFYPYSLIFSVGPTLRYRLSIPWTFETALFFLPKIYHQDSLASDTAKRTGWDGVARFALQKEEVTGNVNPYFQVSLNYSQPSGTEYKSKAIEGEIGNRFYLSPRDLLQVSVAESWTNYAERASGPRTDLATFVRLYARVQLFRMAAWISDCQFNLNNSDDSQYKFSRLAFNSGIGFEL